MSASPKLPHFVITQLFPKSLVLVNERIEQQKLTHKTEHQSIVENTTVQYLGDHLQKISILVYDEKTTFLQDEELEQLTKILQACKLGLKDVAIINLAKYTSLEPRQILQQTNAAIAIVFIPQPSILGLEGNIALYETIQVNNIQCLFSDELEKLKINQVLKSKLWKGLQSLFRLSI